MSKPDSEQESLSIPQRIRDEVDHRDGMHCRVCGKFLGERRALHHVIYGGDARGMGGRRKHVLAEIVTVCWLPGDPVWGRRPCHDLVHSDKGLWQPLLLQVAQHRSLTALALRRQSTSRRHKES